jgi:alanine racemase
VQKNARSALSYREMKTFYPAWIEIDLKQFSMNIEAIKKQIGSALYCLPVKANGYGHGLKEIGKAAERASVDCLGVSNAYEGIQLRDSGIQIPILVFGAFQKEQIEAFVEYDLEFTISSLYRAKMAQEALKELGARGKVHLEIETGMNRTGARPKTSQEILRFIEESSEFELIGIYSHFASSDEQEEISNENQIQRFSEFIHLAGSGYRAHLANSGGVVYFPQSYYQMVRPGLLSYGIFPKSLSGELSILKSCFQLKSRVSYFKVVERGEGISYGATYHTNKKTRIATISIGYGDGYRRSLSNRGEVLIRGKRFSIVGSICMDQLMVDIGESEAYVGDEVVLIGKQGLEEITVYEIANHLNTIPYEVLTGLTERVQRFYH